MITETEIDEKLKGLRGRLPNVLIDDLKEKLMSKQDILTPEQLDKVVERVMSTYSGNLERLTKLDRRVDEIGRYLEDIKAQLMKIVPSKGASGPQPGREHGTTESVPSLSHELPFEPGEVSPVEPSEHPSSRSSTSPEFEKPEARVPEFTGESEGGMGMEKEFEIPPDVRDVLLSPPRTRARLERVPADMASTMMVLKWLGFLIDRVGMQNLENVLEFYYGVGWISEDVLNTLMKYAEGIRPHPREPEWRPDEKLTIRDHIVSLLFIERLRGVRITREVLDSVEREMRLISKILEDMYGV